MFWQSEKERRFYELREKAILEERSAIVEARAEGRVEKAQETICKFMWKRFGVDPNEIKLKVKQMTSLEILDCLMEELFTAGTLEEAQAIIHKYEPQ
jgi:hypothetical protein